MDVETCEHVHHLKFWFWTGCRWTESSRPKGRRCQLKECQQALEDGEQSSGSARQADRRLPRHQRRDTGGDWHAGGAAEEESRTPDQSGKEGGNTVGTQKEKVSCVIGFIWACMCVKEFSNILFHRFVFTIILQIFLASNCKIFFQSIYLI